MSVTVDNSQTCADDVFVAGDVPRSAPDNNATGITSTMSVPSAGAIESLRLSFNITHTYRGDLIVTLIAPSGTTYTAHNRTGGAADNLSVTDLEVARFVGENLSGAWRLRVADRAAIDVGTLNSWSLAIIAGCDDGGGNQGDWSASGSPNLPIIDNSAQCTSLNVAQSGSASGARIDLAGTHAWRSILRATLEHNGAEVDAFGVGTFPTQAGAFALQDEPVPGRRAR